MYHALLPEKSAKALKREYYVWLHVVGFFFLSVAVVSAAICLFPSYLLSGINKSQEKTAMDTIARTESGSTVPAQNDLDAVGALVSSISSFASPSLSGIMIHLAALRPVGVSISSFDTEYDANGDLSVSIQGVASTRDTLIDFRDILQADKSFSGVAIPLSDLAPATHLPFSVKLAVLKK